MLPLKQKIGKHKEIYWKVFNLKRIGVPEVKSFGKYGKYKILVQNLLGSSIDEIFNQMNNNF